MEQTNQYIKQFPDLLKGKKILYVHGFGSSGQSGTAKRIREVLPNATVIAPDLPIHPQEALDLLRNICQTEKPNMVLGTSMGGMYTEMLYGFDRILINPAFGIADTMGEHGLTGKQQFFSPRQDGVQEFYVDKPLVKEYRIVSEQNFSHADDAAEQQRVFGLFGDEDPLVHTYDQFHKHYPQAIRFHGEHRMNDRSFMHAVLPVMRWIDDRQEKHERPIIYIGIETLTDSYRKPTALAQKAVRALIENYQVYFVAPSVSAAPAIFADTVAWLEEYISVPAFDHVVFTNQRQLLYGDYLIESKETTDAMATTLCYGSDTFKTWEDILDYFARLGGQ